MHTLTIEHDTPHATLCPICACPTDSPMGLLGSLLWYRCPACGIDYHDDHKGIVETREGVES